MKFKVFNEKRKEEIEEVYFKLHEEGNNIVLVACNKAGNVMDRGRILVICPYKGINLVGGVNEDIGLPLTTLYEKVVLI